MSPLSTSTKMQVMKISYECLIQHCKNGNRTEDANLRFSMKAFVIK